MKTKATQIIMSWIVLLVLVSISVEPIFAANPLIGKKVWEAKCLACHESQAKGPKSAGEYAGIQWARYIERKRHKNSPLDALDPKESESLIEYLKKYAADSDSPEIGGLR